MLWKKLAEQAFIFSGENLMNPNSCMFPYIEKQRVRMRAKLFQSYPTLCDPMDCSLPGSSVQEILQAGILDLVAIFSSKGSFHPGIEPESPALQTDSLPAELPGKP